MRLKKTRRIALSAVCAAIATVAVVVARFTPVGWVLLYAIAGAMTLLAVRMCGFGYGVLTYCATGLISLAVLPYNLPYVLLIGLHALLREFLFGKQPRKVWRIVCGYVVLLGFFYAMPLAIFSIAKDTLGLAGIIDGIGGLYVFCAVAAVALVVYDFILGYLVRGLESALAKGKAKQKAVPVGEDPFAQAQDTDASRIAKTQETAEPDADGTRAATDATEPSDGRDAAQPDLPDAVRRADVSDAEENAQEPADKKNENQ